MKLSIKNGVSNTELKMRTLQKSNQISIGIQNIDIMLDFCAEITILSSKNIEVRRIIFHGYLLLPV